MIIFMIIISNIMNTDLSNQRKNSQFKVESKMYIQYCFFELALLSINVNADMGIN